MVIQRLQSLLLLVAFILTLVFLIPTLGTVEATQTVVKVSDFAIPFLASLPACVLILINIFMYKKLRLQMILVWPIICLLLLAGISTYAEATAIPGFEFKWFGWIVALIFSIILLIIAWFAMRRDYKLLRSVNRFR